MFDYYREQEVLPTHGAFRSTAELDVHEANRRHVFTQRLFLPPSVFRGARLLEFGPDSGENSLVFARWGATCTLVEPNPNAHSVIKDYFGRFGLENSLTALVESDVKKLSEETLPLGAPFDLIVAEGFIYTVKPESLWTTFFSRIVVPDGFVILFYEEAYGSLMELLLKVIYAAAVRSEPEGASAVARRLFQAKWDSIPHKRSMESWAMDVLRNPFVRLRYFLEPCSLCREMAAAGFGLYSSWPPYKDGLNVEWFKKMPSAEDEIRSIEGFVNRNRLSHVFGRPLFMARPVPDTEVMVHDLLATIDSLIDGFDKQKAHSCIEHLSQLSRLIASEAVVSTGTDGAHVLENIASMQEVLRLLIRNDMQQLIEFCNRDRGFILNWGVPAHFAVFRKLPN